MHQLYKFVLVIGIVMLTLASGSSAAQAAPVSGYGQYLNLTASRTFMTVGESVVFTASHSNSGAFADYYVLLINLPLAFTYAPNMVTCVNGMGQTVPWGVRSDVVLASHRSVRISVSENAGGSTKCTVIARAMEVGSYQASAESVFAGSYLSSTSGWVYVRAAKFATISPLPTS